MQWIGNVFVLILFLLFYFLKPHSASFAIPFAQKEMLFSLLAVCFFLLSLRSLGHLFLRLFRISEKRELAYFLVGSTFLSFLTQVFTYAHLVGEKYGWLYVGAVAVGLAISPPIQLEKNVWKRIQENHSILILVLFILFLFQTITPNHQQDVFSYSIYAPWTWWQESGIRFVPEHPPIFSSGYWEYLYIWSFAFFGQSGSSLLSALVFSQLVHLILGLGGLATSAYGIYRYFQLPAQWSTAAVLLGVTSSASLWVVPIAKNDFGGMFWLFGSALCLLQSRSRSQQLLFAFILGASAGVKLTLALPGVGFLLFFVWFLKQNQNLWQLILSFSIGLVPHLLRNAIFLSNPLHPFFSYTENSKMFGPTNIEISLEKFRDGGVRTIEDFIFIVEGFLRLEPTLLIMTIVFLFLLFRRKWNEAFFLSLISLSVISLGAYWMGKRSIDPTLVRFFLPSIFISIGIALFSIFLLIERHSRKIVAQSLALLLCVLVLFRPGVPWAAVKHFFQYQDGYAGMMQQMPGAGCKDWVVRNLGETRDRIVTFEDDSLYLLPFAHYFSAFQYVDADKVVYAAKRPEELTQNLLKLGFRYVVIGRTEVPYFRVSHLFANWLVQKREPVLFQGVDCIVSDLTLVK